MPSLKELSRRPEGLTSGHRACSGCAAPVILRQMLLAAPNPVVVSCATGCMEVVTTIYPYTAWDIPFIHSAFENVAATISGVETAYRALRKRGKIDREIDFIALGGDGALYDIGFQALSGAMERGHDMLVLCYDNQAYMNTGIQRSGATPLGAHTTTSPAGKVIPGKTERRKDITATMVAHGIPYVAQAAPHNWRDLTRKVEKALVVEGPAFMVVLSPCPLGWGFDSHETIEISRLAAETCFWPLYEVEDGQYRLNYKPREKKPVEEFLKRQVRFRHLFTPQNEHLLSQIQEDVDRQWERLLKLAGET